MICKKDVIEWFKELESYKRIDTMCTLLNMCLPFELRFLGTCLEELGRRDSQELRGMELRANNPQDLATDMVACQKGEPTDKKIRRKMALYLALIRACNRTCVMEIFRTLEGWGERDFMSMNDPDTLQELLLVYTMAANHPVFSFDQKYKCSEIFSKIKENKLVSEQHNVLLQPQQNVEPVLQHSQLHPQDPRQHLQSSHQEYLQQQALHSHIHIAGQPHSQLLTAAAATTHPNIQMPQPIAVPFTQGLPKLINADGSIQHQIALDQHMIPASIIPDSNPISQLTWVRPYQPSVTPLEHPLQSASPSQKSSPSNSRTTSPNRNSTTNMLPPNMHTQQQQQIRNMPPRIGVPLKNVRRPSAETTPPPMGQPQQHQHDIMAPAVKHIEDVVICNDSSGNQLQTLIRNGPPRSGNHPRHKSSNFISPHQQQQPQPQQQQQQQSPVNQHFSTTPNFAVSGPLVYSVQNMTLTDNMGPAVMDGSVLSGVVINSTKSTCSDSGSSISSSGETSPPETPTLSNTTIAAAGGVRQHNADQHQSQQQQQKHQHQQQHLSYNKSLSHARLNGRPEKILSTNAVVGNSVNAGPNLVYVQPQQQSQPLFPADILAPGGNAGNSNLIQTTLTNNNGGAAGNSIVAVTNTSSNPVSSNNNIVTSGVILPQNMTSHQYSPAYNYHIAPAPQTSRPLMPHTPQTPFRLLSNLQTDLIYPGYHQAQHNIPFYTGPPPPVPLRTSNAIPTNTALVAGIPQLPQQQQQPPQQGVGVVAAVPPNAAMLATPQYSAQSVVSSVNKPISCYNCGSQSHSGRDCQEASMDDVTRNVIYKLDYSVSSNASSGVAGTSGNNVVGIGNAGGNVGVNAGGGGGGGNGANNSGGAINLENVQNQQHSQQHHHQKQHSLDGGGTNLGSASTVVQGLPSAGAVSAINSK